MNLSLRCVLVAALIFTLLENLHVNSVHYVLVDDYVLKIRRLEMVEMEVVLFCKIVLGVRKFCRLLKKYCCSMVMT